MCCMQAGPRPWLLGSRDYKAAGSLGHHTSVDSAAVTLFNQGVSHPMEDLAITIVGRPDFTLIDNISPGNFTTLMHALTADFPNLAATILTTRSDFTTINTSNLQPVERNAFQM